MRKSVAVSRVKNPRLSWTIWIILTCAIALIADRWTKNWALYELQSPHVLIPGWLEWSFLANDRFLFWLAVPQWLIGVCVGAALVAIIAWWDHQWRSGESLPTWSLSLMIVGAGSNAFDRLWYGAVIDFIRIPWWSVFNLADLYIIIGGIALFWWLWHNQERS